MCIWQHPLCFQLEVALWIPSLKICSASWSSTAANRCLLQIWRNKWESRPSVHWHVTRAKISRPHHWPLKTLHLSEKSTSIYIASSYSCEAFKPGKILASDLGFRIQKTRFQTPSRTTVNGTRCLTGQGYSCSSDYSRFTVVGCNPLALLTSMEIKILQIQLRTTFNS